MHEKTFKSKALARQRYSERKIDKFLKWCWESKGKITYKEIVKVQTDNNIKCYARTTDRK